MTELQAGYATLAVATAVILLLRWLVHRAKLPNGKRDRLSPVERSRTALRLLMEAQNQGMSNKQLQRYIRRLDRAHLISVFIPDALLKDPEGLVKELTQRAAKST